MHFIKSLINLQQYAYATRESLQIFSVKMTISKFGILDSSVNKDIKSRSVLTLIDIISVLSIGLGVCTEEYKRLCTLYHSFDSASKIGDFSLELIKQSFSAEQKSMEIELAESYALQVYSIFLKIEYHATNLQKLARLPQGNVKEDKINSICHLLISKSPAIQTFLDALIIFVDCKHIKLLTSICYKMWYLFRNCFFSSANVDNKITIMKSLQSNAYFNHCIIDNKLESLIKIENQASQFVSNFNETSDLTKVYSNLSQIHEYSLKYLILILNTLIKMDEEDLAIIIDKALMQKINLKGLTQIKNVATANCSFRDILDIVNLSRFMFQINNNSNIFESHELLKLLEPFKVKIISSNIFDEFKKQKAVQSGSKFTGIRHSDKDAKENWRQLIDCYVVDTKTLLKITAFYSYVSSNFESTLISFMDNKTNLVGIMTNTLLFYFSYFEYMTSIEHKVYVSDDSFPSNMNNVRELIDLITTIFLNISNSYSEPINENLNTLQAFVKYYSVLRTEEANYEFKSGTHISSSEVVKLIFKSFGMEYILHVLCDLIKKGNPFIDILNILVEGYDILDHSSQHAFVDMVLKNRTTKDKLITYNYTKESGHYFKLSKDETVFDLVFRFVSLQSDTWIINHKLTIEKFLKAILSSTRIEIYDYLYKFVCNKINGYLAHLSIDATIHGEFHDMILVLEVVEMMCNLDHVKSYLLSKKFTVDVLKLETAISTMYIGDPKMQQVGIINWKIISALCNSRIGLRRLISGSKSNKIYVEDMPIETHIIEILKLAFSLNNDFHIQEKNLINDKIIEGKLNAAHKILNNSQGKNVFQQMCTINKDSRFLADMFNMFDSHSLGIKLKLVDILRVFKKFKDFKNIYLLDRLVFAKKHADVESALVDIEQLIDKCYNNLFAINEEQFTSCDAKIKGTLLQSLKIYVNKNREKILKNSYKVPKLTFNNEMPESIESRFVLFKANKLYEKDNKNAIKESVKTLDFSRLSQEIEELTNKRSGLLTVQSANFLRFNFSHYTIDDYSNKLVKSLLNRIKIIKNAPSSLLKIKKLEFKCAPIVNNKLGILMLRLTPEIKEPDRKASFSILESEKEQTINQPLKTINNSSAPISNQFVNFINPLNPPKIPIQQVSQQSRGNALLQNLTPSAAIVRQHNNTNQQTYNIVPNNMSHFPQGMPNMQQCNFMPELMSYNPTSIPPNLGIMNTPNSMMPNHMINQFVPFMNPGMSGVASIPNMVNVPVMQYNTADHLLNKRNQSDYHHKQNSRVYVGNQHRQNQQHGQYTQQQTQPNQRQMNDYNKQRQMHNNRNYNHNRRDRPVQEFEKAEFSDDDNVQKKQQIEIPLVEQLPEDMDSNTLQFLKKLRRNRN